MLKILLKHWQIQMKTLTEFFHRYIAMTFTAKISNLASISKHRQENSLDIYCENCGGK